MVLKDCSYQRMSVKCEQNKSIFPRKCSPFFVCLSPNSSSTRHVNKESNPVMRPSNRNFNIAPGKPRALDYSLFARGVKNLTFCLGRVGKIEPEVEGFE